MISRLLRFCFSSRGPYVGLQTNGRTDRRTGTTRNAAYHGRPHNKIGNIVKHALCNVRSGCDDDPTGWYNPHTTNTMLQASSPSSKFRTGYSAGHA